MATVNWMAELSNALGPPPVDAILGGASEEELKAELDRVQGLARQATPEQEAVASPVLGILKKPAESQRAPGSLAGFFKGAAGAQQGASLVLPKPEPYTPTDEEKSAIAAERNRLDPLIKKANAELNTADVLGSLEFIRSIPPSQRGDLVQAVAFAAKENGTPGLLKQFSKSLSSGASQYTRSLAELVGAGGTPEEVELLDQLSSVARQSELYPEGQSWYRSVLMQTGEQVVPMAGMVAAGKGGKAIGGAIGRATAGTGAAGAVGAGMAVAPLEALGTQVGVTAGTFPLEYKQANTELREAGVDPTIARPVAIGTALLSSIVEAGIVAEPYRTDPVLGQGMRKAIQSHLVGMAKNFPGELSEEGWQSLLHEGGKAAATWMDENAPDIPFDAKSVDNAIDDMIEAGPSLALLMGGPAVANVPSVALAEWKTSAGQRQIADQRLGQLREALDNRIITEDMGKNLGLPEKNMANRRTRKAAVIRQEKQLAQRLKEELQKYDDSMVATADFESPEELAGQFRAEGAENQPWYPYVKEQQDAGVGFEQILRWAKRNTEREMDMAFEERRRQEAEFEDIYRNQGPDPWQWKPVPEGTLEPDHPSVQTVDTPRGMFYRFIQPQEAQDAGTVRGNEAEIRQEQGGEDLRGAGEEQVPAEPAGEVAPAREEVQVGPEWQNLLDDAWNNGFENYTASLPSRQDVDAEFGRKLTDKEWDQYEATFFGGQAEGSRVDQAEPQESIAPPPSDIAGPPPAETLRKRPQAPQTPASAETTQQPSEPVPTQQETPQEPPAPPPVKETPWVTETRTFLESAPTLKGAKIDLDETAGTAAITRPDGWSTTIHLGADADVDRVAKMRGRKPKTIGGMYAFDPGKTGLEKGHIYLRSNVGHKLLNHEIVHWLEDVGVITPDEVSKYGGREGIAERYGKWAESEQRKPDTIFQRIYDFLEPLFSSQRRFFGEIGKRGTEVKTEAEPTETSQASTLEPYKRRTPREGEPGYRGDEYREHVGAAREKQLTLTRKRDELQKQHDKTRRNAYKKRGALKSEINQLNKQIREHQNTQDIYSDKLEEANIENWMEAAPTEAHRLAGQSDLLRIQINEENRVGDHDRATAFDKERARIEHNLQAMFLKESQKYADRLNKDEITAVAEHARRDFSVTSRGTVESNVKASVERQQGARPKTIPTMKHLGEERVAAYNEEMAKAAEKSDWFDRQKEITSRAESEDEAASVKASEEAAVQAKADAKKRAKEAAELQRTRRQRAHADLETRYWKEMKTRANKAIRSGKKNKGTVAITSEKGKTENRKATIINDEWAITEGKDSDGKPVFSLTHRPSGQSAASYGKASEVKQLWQFIQELAIPMEGWKTKDGVVDIPPDVLTNIRRAVSAFDDENLGALKEEQLALLNMPKVAEPGFQADLILDSFDLGQHGQSPGIHNKGVGLVKDLINTIPEFRYDPIFTVNEAKQLVYKDGYTLKFNADQFNVDEGELTPGQTVGINLPDLGYKLATQAEVIEETMRNSGVSKSSVKKGGNVVSGTFRGSKIEVTQLGTEESPQWSVTTGANVTGGKLVNQAIQKIRWKQPGENKIEESASEAAQRHAEESRPSRKGFGAGPGGGESTGERIRNDEIPDAIKAPPEQERRLRKAKGMKKPSLMKQAEETIRQLKNVTRAQEHLSNTPENAAANEFFRLLRNVPSMAQDEAVRTTAAIADPLGPKQLQLFERYTIMENLAASLKAGQPLRFGFKSANEVESYLAQLQDVVGRVPEVQEAVETRRKIVKEMTDKLIEYDLLPEAARENTDTYYHQQVHFYMVAQGMKGGGTRAGKVGRSFQKRRVLGEELADEELDYNTSYLEAEISWMTDANMEIEKERLFRQLMDKYNTRPELKDRAKRQNFENVVGGPDVVRRIEQILGDLAESRASEDSQDSDERMRRKQLIEELEEIDPTHPYRRQIAKMAGWFRKEHGIDEDYEDWSGETDDNQFWAMVKEAADEGDVPALAFFKAIHEREEFIRSTLGKNYATWQTLADQTDGVEVFQPEPGNQFYRAFTIPEKLAEALQQEVIDTAELSKDDIRQVLAIAGPRRQFVVPSEIASQLAETRKGEAPHGLALVADEMMRSWKVYTLLNPKRALAYNLRNMTGDIDPVIAADPTLLKYADRAMRELARYHKGHLQLTPELRAARDLGVVGSGFVAEEVPDIKDLAVFRRFVSESGKASLPLRPVKGYMDIVKPLSQWREDSLRYAAFLGYREQLRKGRVKHYGGSKKAVVQQIKRDLGVDAAAAHLSRNLLGDYGNISVAGNWIRRRLMPFWSFQEINLKRVPRLLVNAYEAGGVTGAGKTAGTLSAAAARAILMSRVAWMFAAMWIWNHLVQGGDEEEELAGYDRATPHVILGRNPDGSIRVFRRVGALGDFLEWFGINEAIAMLGKREAGQVDTSDILKEMAFATPEKVLNSMRPDLKALYEIPTGQSLFPEPFRPRSVRRDEAVSHIFGLQDEYKWMKGWMLEDGNTARPHYWQRWVVGVVDPRHSALSQTYELRRDFLKQKGKEESGVFPVSRYKEARDAAKFEDYDAFVAWKRKFVEDRGDKAKDDFKRWLGTIDPVANRLNDSDEIEFETEFLTNEQRQQLTVARNYAHELRDLMVTWWDADERSTEMKQAVAYSAFGRMDTTEPKRKDFSSDEKFQAAVARFKSANETAAQDIKSMATSHEEAQRLLIEYHRRPDRKEGNEYAGTTNNLEEGYLAKGIALAELYGEADPRKAFWEWRRQWQKSRGR